MCSFRRRVDVALAGRTVDGTGRLASGRRDKNSSLDASVKLNDAVVFLSGDLNELVRAQRGIVAFDAYVSRDANVKREESVTKGTFGGHASEDAITIRGGSRKLQLERSVPSVIVLRNEDADDA